MRTGPACHANGIPPTPGHHPDTRQPRTRTDRQVTQPSSFSNSLTGVVTFFCNLHIAPRTPADVVVDK